MHTEKRGEMMERDYYDLSGRVALVTGASSHGIGNQSAKALAAHGAKVFLVARREEKLKDAVAEIEAAGGEASYFAGDASSEEVCKAAVEKCVADFGRLDIMVLAAGTSGLSERSMEDAFNTENWRNIMAVNLDSIFFMVKYGWEECSKKRRGRHHPDRLACFLACGWLHRLHRNEGRHPRAYAEVGQAARAQGHSRQYALSRLHRHRHDPRRH